MNTPLAQCGRSSNMIQAGDGQAGGGAEQLLPLVYDDLRRLAAARMALEPDGHTLQPTALVHEAWMRLAGTRDQRTWNDRAHFFNAAAEVMRHILVDHARRKARLKNGGGQERVTVGEDFDRFVATPDDKILMINAALEELEREYPERARVV